MRSGIPIRRVYLRLKKGVSSKCLACSRSNRRVDKAKSAYEREHRRRQKELHLIVVFRERVLLGMREFRAECDERRSEQELLEA